MKRFVLILLLCNVDALAQQNLESVRPLLNAERAFAALAKNENTRDAFIQFFSDSAVTASQGRGPSKGKSHLHQQTVNNTWLNWWPTLSHIARSGDFGFNTGPWEFRRERTDDKPFAYGQFLSVWKKAQNGEWKVALDMGISHSEPSRTLKLQVSASEPGSSTRNRNPFEIEKQLVEDLNGNTEEAYDGLMSNDVRFLRTGKQPLIGKAEIQQHLKGSSPGVYSFVDGEASSTQDLAYTYGSVTFADKNDPENRNVRSYARIWKKEHGNWKIIVDLLSD